MYRVKGHFPVFGKFIQLFQKQIKMKNKIQEPLLFNPQKHHLHFIQEQIGFWQSLSREQAMDDLNKIGNNLLDLYFGSLTVEEICGEIIQTLEKNNRLEKKQYLKWLGPKEYNKIRSSDGSDWLAKKGNLPERFVHIHPAKNSLDTIRVRGTTLKTIIALLIYDIKYKQNAKTNLGAVNSIRKEYLDLSPVKSLQANKGILRLWEFFTLN
jgi:hypothetical protein